MRDKLQHPKHVSRDPIGAWVLEFLWSLDVGAWCFRFEKRWNLEFGALPSVESTALRGPSCIAAWRV
jgi:hypothetical protein